MAEDISIQYIAPMMKGSEVSAVADRKVLFLIEAL